MIYALVPHLLASLVTLGMLCHALTAGQAFFHHLITTINKQTSVSERCPS